MLYRSNCQSLSGAMGGKSSRHHGVSEERLIEYTELTYLTRTEILHLLKLFVGIGVTDVEHHRIAFAEIIRRFPQLEHNPFRSRIRRVFSSMKDDCFSFEDLLDYASAMSDRCPPAVKSAWAFKLYDFDEDGQLGLNDIIYVVKALTEYGSTRQSQLDVERIAQIVLDDMDIESNSYISQSAFEHGLEKMPDFEHSFTFKI